MQTVVVGAGLAGLVTARHLADAGVDVRIVERRDAVGGRVATRRRDGFTLDRGFQVLLTAYPATRRELDYDALDLRRFRPGAVLAREQAGERSVLADPFRDPGSAVETLFNREVGIGDKLRTLRLRSAVRSRDEAETFALPDRTVRAHLDDWGFSDRFVDRFVRPFYGGITLDRSLATSRRVFDYTFRMLSEGHAALPADGMGAIPEQLRERAERAGATLATGERVERVATDGAVTTTDRTMESDAVVVATDPPAARELTGVDAIPTAGRGSVTQYYSLPAHTAPDTGRRLVLNAEGATPNALVPLSAVAPTYADGDRELVAATFLATEGFDPFDATDDALAERTRRAVAGWYPERHVELDVVATDRVPFAQFDQPPGTHDRLPGVGAPDGSVYLAGEYTAWSSIQGALRSGREAAEAVLAGRD